MKPDPVPAVMVLVAFLFMASAAIHAFGWWCGGGIAAGVYLLMPWRD